MKTLALTLLLFAVHARAIVTCKAIDATTFIPVNEKGVKMGQYGFQTLDLCQSVVKTSYAGDLVCSWTGNTYGIYNAVTGIRYGDSDDTDHWNDIDSCATATKGQAAPSSVVCDWNGHHYIPYNRRDGTALSATDNGWTNEVDCINQAAKTATQTLTCGWDSSSYLYTMKGQQVPYNFRTTDNCEAFMQLFNKAPLFNTMGLTLSKTSTLNLEPAPITNGTPDAAVGFSKWKDCGVPADEYHLTKNLNGILAQGCRPDTLYSWGGFDKLKWFADNLKDGAEWPDKLPRPLFTTESAAATFGYGPIPMRIKVKPNVVFKRVTTDGDNCDAVVSTGQGTAAEFANTIFQRVTVRSDVSFVDFIICSPKVIASWSYATREHYDEIVRDYKWMSTQNYKDWEGYSKENGQDDFIGSTLDNGSDLYSTDFSKEALDVHMAMLRLLANADEGHISAEKGGSKVDHFATRWPIYFNPN